MSEHAPLCVYGELSEELDSRGSQEETECTISYENPSVLPWNTYQVLWYRCTKCFRSIGVNGTKWYCASACPLCHEAKALAKNPEREGVYRADNFLNTPEAIAKTKKEYEDYLDKPKPKPKVKPSKEQEEQDERTRLRAAAAVAWARWIKDFPTRGQGNGKDKDA